MMRRSQEVSMQQSPKGYDFLKRCPEKLFVATKVGRGEGLYPSGYTRESTRTCIEASRKRLGVEAIDLIQLHCVPTIVLEDGAIFDWLRDFQKEGLIRSFGASVETVEEGLLCLRQEELVSLQIIFNIFRQKPLAELLPKAKSAGVGIIVRLPLASGLLAGKFRKDTAFDESDHRHFNRDGAAFNVGETFAGLPFEKGVELADALKKYVPDGMSMAQWAQRWILDHTAVTSIITGASSPAQAKLNAAVSELPALHQEVHTSLADFYQNSVADYIRGPY
jgi:aryl-alcohol dehydrogenase-like predicted oxidoreductase